MTHQVRDFGKPHRNDMIIVLSARDCSYYIQPVNLHPNLKKFVQ